MFQERAERRSELKKVQILIRTSRVLLSKLHCQLQGFHLIIRLLTVSRTLTI